MNNAALTQNLEDESLENGSLEYYDRIIQVQPRAAMQLIKLCLPSLKATKGCIVNIGGAAGSAFKVRCLYVVSNINRNNNAHG